MTQYFGKSYPSPVRWNLSWTLKKPTPMSFTTFICSSHLLWLFRLSSCYTVYPGLDFTVWKPNMRDEWNDGGEKALHKLTDNWVWMYHPRLFQCIFPLFCSYFSTPYILLWGKLNTVTVEWGDSHCTNPDTLKTSVLTENCQMSPSYVRPQNIYIQNQVKNWVVCLSRLTS